MPANTPEECDALFEKYVNEGNLESLVELYEADAVLIPQPGQQAAGRDAIRAALGPMLAAGAKMKLSVSQTIIAGDIAVTYNDWSGRIGGQDIAGKAMEICRKQADGTWKFIIDDPYARS
jgi:uncharacterized protein (TIGR02246 family)